MILKRAARVLQRSISAHAQRAFFCTADGASEEQPVSREQMSYDVLIVGGGPAGLATAIRLKQLQQKYDKEISVAVLEKGSEIGAHILSGNCFDPRGLDELIPEWRKLEDRPPVQTKVTHDKFLLLTSPENAVSVPHALFPSQLKNEGNYIISLGNLCRWLGKYAQEIGVDVFPSTAAAKVLYDGSDGTVRGVQTGDMGISKKGDKKSSYMPGIEILAQQTVIAEGARGSLAEQVIDQFQLRKNCDPQIYGIGLKELWEVDPDRFDGGLAQHTVGWPLDKYTYGGSFMYHMHPNIVHLGFVVGLQYSNPYLNPYEEFQRFKTHKAVRKFLEGGKCVQYGARAISAGGYYSVPKVTFPGGVIVGCSAGLLNVLKIKGAHNAIKSGILAAESIYDHVIVKQKDEREVTEYEENLKNSWVYEELRASRNTKGAFKWGMYAGLAYNGFSQLITKGREPLELRNTQKDCDHYTRKEVSEKIVYPKHDGKITFDLLENLQRSGTYHDDDQPSHLKIKQDKKDKPMRSLNQYGAPEERFCPAKVYEFVEDEKGAKKLQINAQNCLHCKTCSIKMLDEYIDWTVPEGGGGPNYAGM